jgi:amino acid adenylation domain-containing protein/non-ribosomal peptide synthase protein (TIGR01720 family)
VKPNKNIDDIFPLSPLQGGILFHALYRPGTGLYFEQFVCRLGGAVNRKAFADTWQFLVDRHSILRTAFVTKGKREPVQVVFRRLPFTVQELDWTALAPSEQATRLEEFLADDRALEFAFNRPPLMRVTLVQLAPDSWQLIWSHHHILLDGWSLSLLMQEFLTVYQALCDGSEPRLETRRPYGDYINWCGKQDRREAESFWRDNLSGFVSPTPLGIDRTGSTGGAVKQEHYLSSFSVDETASLEAFARSRRLTPSTLFQAAWALLLSRYSGEDDIVFGVTLSGRSAPLPGIEQMIGMFINTLPLRLRASGSQKLGAWLQDIQSLNLDLQQHEYCNLTDIHGWSPLPRGQQLFESLLVYENYPVETLPSSATTGMRIESVELIESTHFLLTAVVIPGHSLKLKISYDTNRIAPLQAQQVSEHLRSLVMQMPEGADLPLGAFKLPLTQSSTSALPGAQPSAIEQTLGERFAETASLHHSRIALSFGSEQWTYAQLAEASSRLAAYLVRLGVHAEVRVGICMERSPQQIVAMLGVIQAGGVYVPLDPAYPAERTAFMVNDSECLFVLTTADLRPRLENLSCPAFCIEDCRSEETLARPATLAPDNAAYVIYTSGSTGQPKGVVVTQRNVSRLFTTSSEHFQFLTGDVWTYFHSFSFDFSVWEIWGALLHGSRLVIVPYLLSRDPASFYRLLIDERVTVLNQTPSAFRQLMAHEQSQAEAEALSLRYLIFGGEALELGSLRPWFERHGADQPQFVNMFGITETTVHVTYRRIMPEDLDAGAVSLIGQPLPDLQVHLLDKYGHPVPPGVKGEMCVGGPGLARGYLNNPDATSEKFSANPFAEGERLYRSGDLARRLPSGDLEYCGRSDQQVKVRGHRIEVGEISAALLRYEGIGEAAARAYTDAHGETRLVVYAVCSNGRQPGVEELRFFLRQYLPDYMLPELFIFCDSFPLTINGKLDVDALPDPESARRGLEEQYVAPASPEEWQLAEIWQSVLGVSRVGRNDNFFALGGDSIRSISIMSQAKDKGIVFSLQQLFEEQTIGRLVQMLSEQKATGEEARLPGAFELVAASDLSRLPPDVEDAYPLARLQAGMLFHSDYGDGSHRYHDAFSFRLRIHFDESKFLSAFQSMVADHPILRTSFHFADLQQPLQYVHRTPQTPLFVYDLRRLDEEEQNVYLEDWLKRQLGDGFEWERPPLFRLFIHRLRDDVVELSFVWHHAILDGWSAATFFKELADRYLSLLNPDEPRPAPAPVETFREFIALEMEALASESERNFWGSMLEGLPQTRIPRWPTPGDESPSGEKQGGFLQRSLHPSLSEQILAFARRAELPVKSVLLAAHLRVLQVLTGGEEVITGLVANGRPMSGDSTRVLGLFLNTVPFRFRLPDCSWLALCQAVLHRETELLPHRRFPLSEISRLNGNTLPFETSFNFVNFHIYEELKERAGVKLLGTRSIEQVDTPLSINFSLGVTDNCLHFGLMYDRAEFSAAQADAIAALYEHALSSLAAEPLALHTTADLLTPGEREQLLLSRNNTARPLGLPLFVHEAVEEQAAKTPSATAVACNGREWSYAELNGRATRLARLLLSKGVTPETPIALLAYRSFDMVCALLAILKAGCAYVPVDAELPEERLAALLQDAGSPLLLIQERLLERVPRAAACEVIVFEKLEAVLSSFSEDALRVPVETANLAYILFTSGSTGKPKGVAVSHESLTNHMQWMQEAFPLSPEDVVLQKTAYSFDASVWEFWAPLMAGAKLVMARPGGQTDPAYLVREIQEQRVTILQVVPSMLEVLLVEQGFAECKTLRRLFVGGEALKTPVSRQASRLLGVPLINLYGPTEATIQTSAAIVSEDEAGATASIGAPIFNTRYFVLNQNLRPVPTGVIGELYIGGAGLARGYWRRPDLTAERFIPDPFSAQGGERLYRTGDMVRYLPGGGLEYLGRADRQFKLRGFRIEMTDIEAALRSLAGISRCAATIQQTEQNDARLVIHYQTASGAALSKSEVKQHLQARLPAYMVPTVFHQLERWPLLANGKTDFAALPVIAPSSDNAGRVLRAASTDTERLLVDIWQRVLRTEQIGIDDNFFDLGGDSILSLQIIAQARRQGLQFTPQELFDNPTVAALALAVRNGEAASSEPFAMSGDVPLTPIQHLFFEQELPNYHHWNQAVLLELSAPYTAALAREALGLAIARHDAFHLRFSRQESGWRQFYGDPQSSFAFEEIDLWAVPDSSRKQVFDAACDHAQTSLNLTEGPLIRAVYFRLDTTGEARLLIVCHHLIIDGVSWRILLEDLRAFMERTENAPGASVPFGAWARKLADVNLTEVAQQEGEFWLRQASLPATSLPVDYPFAHDENRHESAAVVRRELSVEETQALIAGASQNLRASVAEVLLACLTQTITAWSGGNDLLISLEGHGRESLIADADLSHSIGWFTSLYPLRLETQPGATLPARLAAIKRRVREVPREGIGFGLLRYMGAGQNLAQTFADCVQPEMSLNYLGQFDNSFRRGGPFRLGSEPIGNLSDASARRSHLLEVVALIVKERLVLQWIYSRNVHRPETIDSLAEALSNSLKRHLEAAQAPNPASWIREDFPLAPLDDAQFGEVLAEGQSFEELWPLSPVQEGMLFHTLQEETAAGVYIQQLTGIIRGRCDVRLLEQAWQVVLQQHANLRATFVWGGLPRPLQKIESHARLPFTLLDWRDADAAEQKILLSRFLDEDRARGFNLRQGPLMRLALIRLAGDVWQLLWTHHHILLDGWSLPLILSQVVKTYRTLSAGLQPALASTPPYSRYLSWLQQQNQVETEGFWRSYLSGYSEPVMVALGEESTDDAPQPPDISHRELKLSESLSDELRSFAGRRNLTLNNIIQAAWGFVLCRHTHASEIVYGITVSGRPATLPGVEEMVGLFINTLPLRINISQHQPIDEWLSALQVSQSELLRFQHSRLVEIAGWSEIPRGRALFDTIFVFENYPTEEEQAAGVNEFAVEQLTTLEQNHYPLTLYVTPGREIKFACSFQPLRFPHLVPDLLLSHLQQVIRNLLEHEGGHVLDLQLVSAQERRQIVEAWNETEARYDSEQLVPARFAQAAALNPRKIALSCGTDQVSYGELEEASNRLARFMSESGVGCESRVAILLERTPRMVCALLAVLKTGAAYIPLDPSFPKERLRRIIEEADPHLILTSTELSSLLPETQRSSVSLDSEWTEIARRDSAPIALAADSQNLAYLIFTSGSTGQPKGVQITHGALLNILLSFQGRPGLSSQDTFVAVTTISFDIAALEIFLPLLVGATLVLAPRETAADGVELARLLEASGATAMQATPVTWRMLLAADWRPNAGFRAWCGGELLPNDLAESLLTRGLTLWNVYGPTETTIWSTINEVHDSQSANLIGRPIANTQVYVLDEALNPLPAGVVGQLHIGGDGLTRGYLNLPGLTAEKLIPDPFSKLQGARLYRTGDFARFTAAGELEYLGRMDLQTKVDGFRIELGDVEAALRSLPGIHQAAATVTRDERNVNRLVGYLVYEQSQSPYEISKLRGMMLERVPAYMVPASWVVLEALPLTPNNKLDRTALLTLASRPEPRRHLKPRSALEEALVELWKEAFQAEHIGVDDNFFDLGGHSLIATQLHVRMMRVFQVELPLRELFRSPTIESLAAFILRHETTPGQSEKVARLFLTVKRMSPEEREKLLAARAGSTE